jgi:predicted PurR-regulated permease PerM
MHAMIFFLLLIGFLWIGRSIFIPFLIALFLWYMINVIADYFRLLLPYRKQKSFVGKLFDWTSRILSIGAIGLVISVFATHIHPMFAQLQNALPVLQAKLTAAIEYLSTSFGVSLDTHILPNFAQIAATIGASAASIVASVGMILIYILFLFVEQGTFGNKMKNLFANKRQSKKYAYIIESVDKNMKRYLFMKTIISGMTGLTAYIWLRAIGLEFAGAWAFLMFIMNYIPTIGSIIACALPIMFALAVGPSIHLAILTAAGLIGLEILFGNILDPKLTGKTLNLSTLAILINLVFWGMIWGFVGMFLSVPLLMIIFIITAQFDSTRPIAVLLSARGNIPDIRNDD